MTLFLAKLHRTHRGRIADLLVFGYFHDQLKSILHDKNVPDGIVIECLRYYFVKYAWDQDKYPKTGID